MNTPADKPDLPPLGIPGLSGKWPKNEVLAYASHACDQREAWARADERRKALEKAADICERGWSSAEMAADRIRALIEKE